MEDNLFYSPSIFNNLPILAAQSLRNGGFSNDAYTSLNLGLSTSDEAATVQKNRNHFFKTIGAENFQKAFSHQVHGCNVLKVDNACSENGYDALHTTIKNILLCVTIADCAPVLIYDTENNAVAAIHSGWRGTVANIVGKTIDEMSSHYGTKGENCVAYIGPCIGKENFEVGEEVVDKFEAEFIYKNKNGNLCIDLKGCLAKQLIKSSVKKHCIEITQHCTFKDSDLFFSHRRDQGVTGRMLGVIGLL